MGWIGTVGWARALTRVCVALALAGCTGEIDVWLTDPSAQEADAVDVESMELPLDAVEVRTASGWVTLKRGPNPYNLLDFSGEETPVELATLREAPARLAHDELPLGAVTEARLRLLLDEEIEVEDAEGTDHEVRLPPNVEAGLLVPVSVVVTADEPATIELALDVRAALTVEVGGGYVFEPELTVEE